jgi:hypothetical protein
MNTYFMSELLEAQNREHPGFDPIVWWVVLQIVTVDRRIAPPTAVPERRVILSHHAAPQCPDACHAYLAGDMLAAPAGCVPEPCG